jgi:cation diffusion facilitator family transporter
MKAKAAATIRGRVAEHRLPPVLLPDEPSEVWNRNMTSLTNPLLKTNDRLGSIHRRRNNSCVGNGTSGGFAREGWSRSGAMIAIKGEPMTEPLESRLTLFAALAVNLGIAGAKFAAAAATGSAAMLAQGVHSVVDSLNQLLLLYGQKRSERPPDIRHPFGYGGELYFWSFVAAALIFAGGALLSIYGGIRHIREPAPLTAPLISYAVLSIALIFEGASWLIAMRAFDRGRGGLGRWEAARHSEDRASFVILFEDSVAMFGLFAAAAGIALSHVTGDSRWDGGASVLIGLALAGVALLLANEARGMMIGELADPAIADAVRAEIGRRSEVRGVAEIRVFHLGPRDILVGLSVDFSRRVPVGRVEAMIAEAESELRQRWPAIRAIYIRPQAGTVDELISPD